MAPLDPPLTTQTSFTDQMKSALTWTKDAAYSAGASTCQLGKEAAMYLGKQSITLIQSTPQAASSALSAVKNVLASCVQDRSAVDIALDITILSVGSFAAYKFISYGPEQALSDFNTFMQLPGKEVDALARMAEASTRMAEAAENNASYTKVIAFSAGIIAAWVTVNSGLGHYKSAFSKKTT